MTCMAGNRCSDHPDLRDVAAKSRMSPNLPQIGRKCAEKRICLSSYGKVKQPMGRCGNARGLRGSARRTVSGEAALTNKAQPAINHQGKPELPFAKKQFAQSYTKSAEGLSEMLRASRTRRDLERLCSCLFLFGHGRLGGSRPPNSIARSSWTGFSRPRSGLQQLVLFRLIRLAFKRQARSSGTLAYRVASRRWRTRSGTALPRLQSISRDPADASQF